MLALAACGRVGFDTHNGDGAGSGSSGTPIATTLPSGGQLEFLDVTTNGAWYGVTHLGAVVRSADHATWGTCGARAATQVAVLDDGTVYAGGPDTAVSTDQCATWTELGAGRFTNGLGDYNNVIYALLDNGLRSYNGGTWTTIPTPLDGARFKSFSMRSGSPFLIGTGNGLLHATVPSAWTAVTGFSSDNMVDVATTPTHTYAISAASGTSSGEVACSDGSAGTWTSCFGDGGTAISADPLDDQHAFAGVYDNLIETQDAFASTKLEQRGGAMGYAAIEALRFLGDGTVVVATHRGVYAAAHGTIDWQPALTGLDAWVVNDIATSGDEVYVATTGGVLHGTRGQPYTHSFDGMNPNTIVNAIVVAPDGTVIAAGRQIWTSTDHGATWTQSVPLGLADAYRAFSALIDGTRVWVGAGGSVYVADAPYTAWTRHALGHRVNALVRTAARLWAATDVGLLSSDDDGATWQATAVTISCDSLALLPDGSLAVGTVMGLAISDPSLTSFSTRSPTVTEIRHITVAGTALVVATPGGLYASRDSGLTWTRGLTTDSNAVVVDPADGQLVVGTNGGGLAKTPVP